MSDTEQPPNSVPSHRRFSEGCVVELTRSQRNFVAKRVLKGLPAARANRDRIDQKYPNVPDACLVMDGLIHSLITLGFKIGLTAAELGVRPERPGARP